MSNFPLEEDTAVSASLSRSAWYTSKPLIRRVFRGSCTVGTGMLGGCARLRLDFVQNCSMTKR